MITQRIRGCHELLVVMQLAVAMGSYWAHFGVVVRFYAEAAALGNYVLCSVVLLVGLLLEAIHRPAGGSGLFQEGLLNKHRVALRQTVWAAVPVVFFLVGAKDAVISRVFLFTFLPVLYGVLLLSSWKLPRVLARISFEQGERERTLVIGSSRKIEGMHGWLVDKTQLGLELVGVLCDERVEAIGPWRVLGRVGDLEAVVRRERVTQVIAAELPAWPVFLGRLTSLCEGLGVRFLVISDLEEKFRHRVIHMESDGRHIFALRQEPLESPLNRVVKRVLDLVVAVPVVVMVLPVLSVVVALLQWWQSPGPLFYRQERAGYQGRRFRILKFRTMHEQGVDSGRQATRGDERVFPAGRWLRRFSLDEVPQFVNVLWGEMSVAGPRPHLPEHDALFARLMEGYYIRAFAKPGITGLAQARGLRGEARTEESVRARIASDIYYLENWSLSADLLILGRTCWQMVVPPKTAY